MEQPTRHKNRNANGAANRNEQQTNKNTSKMESRKIRESLRTNTGEEKMKGKTFFPKPEYEKEEEFSEHLNTWLNGKKIKRININTKKESQNTQSNIVSRHQQKRKTGVPDLNIIQDEKIDLEYRKLSREFFIECKIGRKYTDKSYSIIKEISDNLSQFIRYKYKKESKKHLELEKYGDYHVIIAAPYFLSSSYNPRSTKTKREYNEYNLTRWLWKLGLGILHYNPRKERTEARFNEQEAIYFGE